MNFQRIESTIDIEVMNQSHVAIVGGAVGISKDLVRSGLGAVTLIDYDRIDASNPTRQDFDSVDLGHLKTEATARDIRRVNPEIDVEVLNIDFCSLSRDQMEEQFAHTDLFIFATDFFPAQARGSIETLRLGKPAIWIGLYRGGRAGEIIHYVPGITPACYRCICGMRYEAFPQGKTKVSSDGGTIFDLHFVDAIAGALAVGILTRGSDNRMGRLIEQLGDRNLLQMKMDPEYTLGDKDIFKNYLGDNPANFSFTTIALSMERESECPDCATLHVEDAA